MSASSISASFATCFVLVGAIGWYACHLLYNVYFHPLASFPGPKLAGATRWYEAYFDLFLGDGGQYMWEVRRMHQKYGPIVRVGPNEVHINDPTFRQVLYGIDTVRHKVPYMIHIFGSEGSALATEDHYLHRMRRNAIAQYFSKRSVQRLEGVIKTKVLTMCERLSEASRRKEVVPVRRPLVAIAVDIVTEYYTCANALDELGFSPRWDRMMIGASELVPMAKQFPGIVQVSQLLPLAVMRKLNPIVAEFSEFAAMCRTQVIRIQHELRTRAPSSKETNEEQFPTVFHEIMSSRMPEEEKSAERMAKEAMTFVGAASETSSTALTSIIFHVAEDARLQSRLRNELKAAMPSSSELLDWQELEKLPFLTALIKEGLRQSCPNVGRNPHVANEPLQYGGWTMPPGTYIGMSIDDALHHPDIFPEPTKFDPERWLSANADDKHRRDVQMAFVPFGTGSRRCVGTNLAWAQMYHIIAAIFRRFEVKMVDTKLEDIMYSRDHFVSKPPRNSTGAKMVLVELE